MRLLSFASSTNYSWKLSPYDASDIHFEPYESVYRVRFRIDGILQEMTHPPVKLSARLASRIKIMAHLDISERARLRRTAASGFDSQVNSTIDVRVNSLPTLWGEKIVLRLLDPLHTNFDPELVSACFLHQKGAIPSTPCRNPKALSW